MNKKLKKEEPMANKSDHDLLITLVETVKNNNDNLLNKVQEVKEKVQEVNDGINFKVTDHENRIKTIEKLIQTVGPEEALKKLNEVFEWKKSFQTIWKFVITIASIVGAIIGFLLATISGLLGLFR